MVPLSGRERVGAFLRIEIAGVPVEEAVGTGIEPDEDTVVIGSSVEGADDVLGAGCVVIRTGPGFERQRPAGNPCANGIGRCIAGDAVEK